jgi:hypothetical protein
VRWEERSLLVPAPVPVPWASSHAMVPFVDTGRDGPLRIYFTARDERCRSHTGWVELEEGRPSRYSAEPVIAPGPLGAFDDSGAMGSCLVRRGDTLYLYYIGWFLGLTVPFHVSIGCAVSEDGETFTKVSRAPVLGRSEVDPYLTTLPWVLVEDGLWRMWYVSGSDWRVVDGKPRHWYHVKYAESRDGLDWEPTGRVCIDYANESEYAIARPCVVRDGDRYRMWFCARGDSYRFGYADSADGLTWDRRDDEAGIDGPSGSWDSEMQAYPFVFDDGGARRLLYNGNGYGTTGIGAGTLVP